MCIVMILVKSLTRQNGVDLGTGRGSALTKNYIFQLKYSMGGGNLDLLSFTPKFPLFPSVFE